MASIFSIKEFIRSTVRKTIKGSQRNGYFALTQNMYSFILPLSTYLFNTYYMSGTILGSKEEEDKRDKTYIPVQKNTHKQGHTQLNAKKISKKCYERNPLTWNEIGGSDI